MRRGKEGKKSKRQEKGSINKKKQTPSGESEKLVFQGAEKELKKNSRPPSRRWHGAQVRT